MYLQTIYIDARLPEPVTVHIISLPGEKPATGLGIALGGKKDS